MKKYKNLAPDNNFTHVSEYCRNPACVYGFIDWFNDDDVLMGTTVCAVCKPDTFDYLKMFPDVGKRTHAVLQSMAAHRAKKLGRKSEF
jgi:hypothetical protein